MDLFVPRIWLELDSDPLHITLCAKHHMVKWQNRWVKSLNSKTQIELTRLHQIVMNCHQTGATDHVLTALFLNHFQNKVWKDKIFWNFHRNINVPFLHEAFQKAMMSVCDGPQVLNPAHWRSETLSCPFSRELDVQVSNYTSTTIIGSSWRPIPCAACLEGRASRSLHSIHTWPWNIM